MNRILKLPCGFDFMEIKFKTLFILLRIIKQNKIKEKIRTKEFTKQGMRTRLSMHHFICEANTKSLVA